MPHRTTLIALLALIENWFLFATAIFAGSSLASVAQLLWEGKSISGSRIIGAVLLSGFAGSIAAMLLYSRLIGDPAMLTAISLLAGVGGATTLDLMTSVLNSWIEKHRAKRDDH